MKEGVRDWASNVRRKAAGVLLATSMVGGVASPSTAHTSVYSCEHFLANYSPAMDANLQMAIDALDYRQLAAFTIYPNPDYARKNVALVIQAIKNEPLVEQKTVTELQHAENLLPVGEGVEEMQKNGVNDFTFLAERREIADAKIQLDTTVNACEQLVPTSLRRDNWYTQEQVIETLHAIWDKYKLEILIALGFLGAGILEKLFIGDEN